MNDIKEILAKLVNLRTVSGNELEFEKGLDLIDGYLSPLGLKRYDYDNEGVKSAVWSNSANLLEPEILLSAHIDVVPAEDNQFTMTEKEGKLYGRGVSDMKMGIVSFISALEQLHEAGGMPKSVAVMITTDEEEGGVEGTNYLVNEVGFRPKLVILPDGGENFKLVVGSKGVLHLKVTAIGIAGHAAYPWDGVSANDLLIRFLSKLRELYPQPISEVWENTLNIGKLSGGTQTNQIADSAEARLDFRLIPGTDVNKIIEQLKSISSKAQIEKLVEADPFVVDLENIYVKKWIKIVDKGTGRDHGASDARFFSPYKIPVIMTKPNAGGDHSKDEWLDIESWQLFNKILENFLTSSTF